MSFLCFCFMKPSPPRGGGALNDDVGCLPVSVCLSLSSPDVTTMSQRCSVQQRRISPDVDRRRVPASRHVKWASMGCLAGAFVSPALGDTLFNIL